MCWQYVVHIGPDGLVRWLSALPDAAIAAGLNADDYVGKPLWSHAINQDELKIAFAECLTFNRDGVAVVELVAVTPRGRYQCEYRHVGDIVVAFARLLAHDPELTAAEREVLSMLAEDLTSKRIGEQTFRATSTVNTIRSTLRRKFGVETAGGLLLAARDAGYV